MKTIAKLILLSFLMGGSVAFGVDTNNPTLGAQDQSPLKAVPCPEDRNPGDGGGTDGTPAVVPGSGNNATNEG